MMNVLGLSLMLTSLVVACVFSPYSSSSSSPNSNTIVKDGHRVVVVEYDQDGNHNTKISISPPGHVVQGGSDDHHHHASKELICDVYGRCKHKITDAMDRTKDMMSETAHDTINMIYDKKENAADVVGKARETVYNRAHNLQQQTKETVDKAKEKAHDVQQQTKETVDKGKEKAHDVQQQTKETVDKAKEKAHDVKQQTKETVDKAKEKGQRFKEHVVRNVSEAKDSLGNAVRRGATNIVGSMEKVTGVANLLGFATAYGMNVWVTFISSYVLSRAMPRQSFGMVQSKIYPLYFRAMAYCIGIALLGHVLSHTKGMPHIFQAYNLLASLFTVFINSLYLEPRATKVSTPYLISMFCLLIVTEM
ncbi:hypothetical protein Lalb_Chr19g0140481 [Lupinus albus]|uniref:TMEM205-like domain-containing protein n=1 Tax=Lupinus albus TaxID=3870 RepID=A0A6A4NW11_LUPAL|nr:hypothetical protein Lalb_Chr19g0140481 [Lupinus albus]